MGGEEIEHRDADAERERLETLLGQEIREVTDLRSAIDLPRIAPQPIQPPAPAAPLSPFPCRRVMRLPSAGAMGWVFLRPFLQACAPAADGAVGARQWCGSKRHGR